MTKQISAFSESFSVQSIDFVKFMSQAIDSKITELKEIASIDFVLNLY